MEANWAQLKLENTVNEFHRTWMTPGTTAHLAMEGVYHPHAPEGSHGMLVPNSWLGQSYLTRVAGMTAVLTLPRTPVEEGRGLRPPPFSSLDDAYSWTGWGFPYLEPQWGHGYDQTGSYVRSFRVALDIQTVDPADAAESFRRHQRDWWKRVEAWVELLSSQDLDGVDLFNWSSGSATLWTEVDRGHPVSLLGRSSMWQSPRPSMGFRNLTYLGDALTAAGLGHDPPLPWTMLRDALRAFRAGHYRRTVLEAGIATELAVTDELRRLNQLIDDKATLGPLVRELAKHSPEVTEHVNEHVVQVRNDVMHRGHLPTQTQAVNAFDLTRRLLEHVHPANTFVPTGLVVAVDGRLPG